MVQFIPAKDDWAEAFRQIGGGVAKGYMNRSDENAVRKSIEDLGPNPSARDVLNALTKTKTHSREAKQQALSNFLGVEQLEELKRKARAAETQESAEFEEKKRSTKKSEEQRERQLDISENKSIKTHQRAATDDQIKAGLQTVKEMRDIGKKGNLGIGTGIRKVFSAEAAKDAGQYEQLGKSLIQLSTTIPIRNKLEFETLAEKLYDPSIRDAEREGVLNAMENILNRSLIDNSTEQHQTNIPAGKVRVRDKNTGKTGTVTPFEGMDSKYDRI